MIDVRYIYEWEGIPINEYTINNGKYQLSAINLGAAITKIIVPNKEEKLENVTLRYYDYKLYYENKYMLGALVDYQKFLAKSPCVLTGIFECEIEANALVFTQTRPEQTIKVRYVLIDHFVMIEYIATPQLELSHMMYLNLSGNLKTDIISHTFNVNKIPLDFKEIKEFQPFDNVKTSELLHVELPETGIHLHVESSKKKFHLSVGEEFQEAFYLQRKILANRYSGFGIVVEGCSTHEYVCLTF